MDTGIVVAILGVLSAGAGRIAISSRHERARKALEHAIALHGSMSSPELDAARGYVAQLVEVRSQELLLLFANSYDRKRDPATLIVALGLTSGSGLTAVWLWSNYGDKWYAVVGAILLGVIALLFFGFGVDNLIRGTPQKADAAETSAN